MFSFKPCIECTSLPIPDLGEENDSIVICNIFDIKDEGKLLLQTLDMPIDGKFQGWQGELEVDHHFSREITP